MSPLTFIHVSCVTIGVISGLLAMFFSKGSSLHRIAGTIFFVAMLAAATSAGYLAAFVHPNRGNLTGTLLTCYLVSTAWVAAKRREKKTGLFDWIALAFITAVGIAGYTWGSQGGRVDGYPVGFYFVFGTIALLFALADVRMLVRGGYAGAQRIGRHLFRMTLALLFTLMSGYPGQAKLFPPAWRETRLLWVPHVLVLGALLLAIYRNSRRPTRSLVGDPKPQLARAA